MKTFAITTLGCKVNQYESQQIRELLERFGLTCAEPHEKPDLAVINTCCVTQTASAKSRRQIRKAQKLNPNAHIVVCGCLPLVQIGELIKPVKNIHCIRDRESVADILCRIISDKTAAAPNSLPLNLSQRPIKTKIYRKIKPKNKLSASPALTQLTSFKDHTRAFLKVQDGCDGFCSYCIIPKTRPFVHSKPLDNVLKEAAALVNSGHKEIVVTGIFLGAYGQKTVRRNHWHNHPTDNLPTLLDKLAQIPNLARIRLSSLEPADVTDQLLDTFCKHPNIMPHLHLSLQSGSNAILKRMCRQYSADQFIEKVGLIKSRLDQPAITADIIVGFPGESDADFLATLDLAKNTGFAKMHVFTFSPRTGTSAAIMPNHVSKKIIKERSQIIRDLDIELGQKFRQQFIGQTATILIENTNSQISGRSERYFTVYLEKPDPNLKKNDLLKVKLIQSTPTALLAQPL